jgi:hypothetical protein
MMNSLLKRHLNWATAATRWVVALTLISWAASAADAPSKPAASVTKLPAAADVIAKSLKALGGRDAILKHTSTRLKGTWSMPAQSVNGEFEMFQAKPNRRAMRMKVGEMGEIVNTFDGKAGWVISPFAPPTLLEGKMLEQARDDADYYSILHDPASYRSMETVALTQFDNRECYELKVVLNSGRENREFYDVKTGLLAGVRGTQESPQGSSEAVLTLQAYQKFGDLQQVSKMKIQSEQGDVTITVTSVEYDTVPDSQFEAPAEIKALLKK